MPTSIVEARPEHASFLAWVILTAFRSHGTRGLWDILIGGDQSQCLRYLEALTTSGAPHLGPLFHLSRCRSRRHARSCIGRLLSYFDEELGMAALQKGAAETDKRLGRSRAESAAGLQRTTPKFLVMPHHEPGTWIVENVATHPDFRRRGLVDALLAAMLERGRQRGAAQAGIGVMIGDDAAQRAYKKAGFRVIAENCHPDFERVWGCPGMRVLTRRL